MSVYKGMIIIIKPIASRTALQFALHYHLTSGVRCDNESASTDLGPSRLSCSNRRVRFAGMPQCRQQVGFLARQRVKKVYANANGKILVYPAYLPLFVDICGFERNGKYLAQ